MTVDATNKVDIVAWRPDLPTVRLVIADHLDWKNENEHLHTLQSKLNTYLEFVESGQLLRDFPHTAGKSVQIEVAFLHDPPQTTVLNFLLPATEVANKYGLAFSWAFNPGAT